jgi:hypothetical protein
MAVVVNEFEVVPEPAPPPVQAESAAAQPGVRVPDIELLLAEQEQRAERVRAY